MTVNAFKRVTLYRVLAFENAPVPLSLFRDGGSYMSIKKSDFLKEMPEGFLDPECSEKQTVHSNTDCILFDAMAVILWSYVFFTVLMCFMGACCF